MSAPFSCAQYMFGTVQHLFHSTIQILQYVLAAGIETTCCSSVFMILICTAAGPEHKEQEEILSKRK